MNDSLFVIIGPTASGKTRMAVQLAARLGGEIISADSRQVYRGMDVGTGKDIAEYQLCGKEIPYHLIDIVPAGERYNVYRYLHDFYQAYQDIGRRGAVPLLCGGSGMYIEAVCRGFDMPQVPENKELRREYEHLSHKELVSRLSAYAPLHNTTDTESRKRLIRAIEIAHWKRTNFVSTTGYPKLKPCIVGLYLPAEERRARIDRRLEERLQTGLIEEAQRLMQRTEQTEQAAKRSERGRQAGLSVEDMMYYGLEYKYLALYLTGVLSYDEMKQQLRIAIHQFAKRQMTWFRGMERRGLSISWIDAMQRDEEVVKEALLYCGREGCP